VDSNSLGHRAEMIEPEATVAGHQSYPTLIDAPSLTNSLFFSTHICFSIYVSRRPAQGSFRNTQNSPCGLKTDRIGFQIGQYPKSVGAGRHLPLSPLRRQCLARDQLVSNRNRQRIAK
jgi:hypothetical protein